MSMPASQIVTYVRTMGTFPFLSGLPTPKS